MYIFYFWVPVIIKCVEDPGFLYTLLICIYFISPSQFLLNFYFHETAYNQWHFNNTFTIIVLSVYKATLQTLGPVNKKNLISFHFHQISLLLTKPNLRYHLNFMSSHFSMSMVDMYVCMYDALMRYEGRTNFLLVENICRSAKVTYSLPSSSSWECGNVGSL